MIGQVIRPSCQVTDKVHFPNSVKAKALSHANTEPSMSEKLKACVENAQEASKTDEGSFRTLWKHSELTRNKLVAQKCVVTDCVMLMMVKRSPPYQATGMVQKPNSVNPKLFEHGNTELNSTRVDKCVETMGFPTLVVDDIVRTIQKCIEMCRNVASAYMISCNNNRMGRNRHDLISGCQGNRNLFVRKYHGLV